MAISEVQKAAILAARDAGLSPWVPVTPEQLEQGPLRLRGALCSVPFYAKKAAREQARSGDEMNYWRALFLSAPHMTRSTTSQPTHPGSLHQTG
jgi:hypothetical protein